MKRTPFPTYVGHVIAGVAKQSLYFCLLFSFLINTLGLLPTVQADEFKLPAPGVMVRLSPEFNPAILKGIKVDPDNPFQFDFILDQGDSSLSSSKEEATKLIKYFLASLTVPEKDLWVNLSPYEKNRIVPQSFGQTEMGRDLLAEDYMLKQITASLIYPEDTIGKKFWRRIYEEASKKFGTTNIPVNTFNKVWIIPEKAVVYENVKVGTAYVVESKLKVMLEGDYFAMSKHGDVGAGFKPVPINDVNALGSQIVREIVIPELTKEVNEDKNFSQLRQVYNSLILATWYKKKIRDSILEQVYADKKKIAGVGYDSSVNVESIYQRYLQAFKKGVYNYIKEDVDPSTQETIPRKYFSGGTDLALTSIFKTVQNLDPAMFNSGRKLTIVSSKFNALKRVGDFAMTNNVQESMRKRIVLLEKRINLIAGDNSGLNHIEEINASRDEVLTSRTYDQLGPILNDGRKIIRLNLNGLSGSTKETYEFLSNYLINISYFMAGDMGFRSEGKSFLIFELLKNAFVHGNHLNWELPIYIKIDNLKDRVDVYDLNLNSLGWKADQGAMNVSDKILHGRGMVGDAIQSYGYFYSRAAVTADSKVIGAMARIDFAMKTNGLVQPKPFEPDHHSKDLIDIWNRNIKKLNDFYNVKPSEDREFFQDWFVNILAAVDIPMKNLKRAKFDENELKRLSFNLDQVLMGIKVFAQEDGYQDFIRNDEKSADKWAEQFLKDYRKMNQTDKDKYYVVQRLAGYILQGRVKRSDRLIAEAQRLLGSGPESIKVPIDQMREIIQAMIKDLAMMSLESRGVKIFVDSQKEEELVKKLMEIGIPLLESTGVSFSTTKADKLVKRIVRLGLRNDLPFTEMEGMVKETIREEYKANTFMVQNDISDPIIGQVTQWVSERYGDGVDKIKVLYSYDRNGSGHMATIFNTIVYRKTGRTAYLQLYHEMIHSIGNGFITKWLDEATTEKLTKDFFNESGDRLNGERPIDYYNGAQNSLEKVANVIGWQPIIISYLTGDEDFVIESLGENGKEAFSFLESITMFPNWEAKVVDRILNNLGSRENLLALGGFLAEQQSLKDQGQIDWKLFNERLAKKFSEIAGVANTSKRERYKLSTETYKKLVALSQDSSNPTLQKNAKEMIAKSDQITKTESSTQENGDVAMKVSQILNFPEDSQEVQYVVNNFSDNWQEAISMIGAEIINPRRKGLIDKMLQKNLPAWFMADVLHYRPFMSDDMMFEDMPDIFQNFILNNSGSKRGVSRLEFNDIFIWFFQNKMQNNYDLLHNIELENILKDYDGMKTSHERWVELGQFVKATNLSDKRIIQAFVDDRKGDTQDYFYQKFFVDYEKSKIQESMEEVTLNKSPFDGFKDIWDIRLTKNLDNNTSQFNLVLKDNKKLLEKFPELAKWLIGDGLFSATINYQIKDGSVADIQWLQVFLSFNDKQKELRLSFDSLDQLILGLFEQYLVEQNIADTVIAPNGAALFAQSRFYMHRNTIIRQNQLFATNGYELDSTSSWRKELLKGDVAMNTLEDKPIIFQGKIMISDAEALSKAYKEIGSPLTVEYGKRNIIPVDPYLQKVLPRYRSYNIFINKVLNELIDNATHRSTQKQGKKSIVTVTSSKYRTPVGDEILKIVIDQPFIDKDDWSILRQTSQMDLSRLDEPGYMNGLYKNMNGAFRFFAGFSKILSIPARLEYEKHSNGEGGMLTKLYIKFTNLPQGAGDLAMNSEGENSIQIKRKVYQTYAGNTRTTYTVIIGGIVRGQYSEPGSVDRSEQIKAEYLKAIEKRKGSKTDDAMSSTGGIDLTPANMNLQTKIDSSPVAQNDKGIKFHLDPGQLEQLQNAAGFVPVIINMRPMLDLKSFLDSK